MNAGAPRRHPFDGYSRRGRNGSCSRRSLERFRHYLLLLAPCLAGGVTASALVLRYYEGLSLDEISARLGQTPAAVAGLPAGGLKRAGGRR